MQPEEESAAKEKPFLSVDRRANITKRELENEYLTPMRPVIIPNAGDLVWRDSEPLDFGWLKKHYGDAALDDLRAWFGAPIGLPVETIRELKTLGGFIEAIERAPAGEAPDESGLLYYLDNLNIPISLPKLHDRLVPYLDLMGPNLMARHPVPMLQMFSHWQGYLAPRRTGLPGIHADPFRTWVVTFQAVGAKSWYVFPPSEAKHLYLKPDDNGWCNQTPFNVTSRETISPGASHYPLFAEMEHRYDMRLEAGDIGIMPPSWFHGTWHHEPSFAVSCRHLRAKQLASHTADLLLSAVTMGTVGAHRWMVLRR